MTGKFLENFEAANGDIENLPEIGADEKFCFECGPQVPCFNRCCADLALPLTPYDVLRLRQQLNITSAEFLNVFTTMNSYPDTGFPLPMLRMVEGPDAPCPFVSPAGCSVYEDRPGACRSYPLGRGAKMAENGVKERFFVVREEHCLGFDADSCRTPLEWFREEGLEKYNHFNDRYMRLQTMVRATGKPLEQRLVSMALVSLYQLDRFRELIEKMRIFDRVELPETRKALVLEDSLRGNEACLDFALDWLELVIFGKAENLNIKGNKSGT